MTDGDELGDREPTSSGAARPRPVAAAGPAQRAAWIALALALAATALWVIWSFVAALLWAAVFAIATWPLYRRFGRLMPPSRHGRELEPLAFTLIVIIVFVLPLAAAAIEVVREAVVLVRWAIGATRSGLPVPAWLDTLPFVSAAASRWWQENLTDPEAVHALLRHANRAVLVNWTRVIGAELVHRLLIFGFTLLTLFFLFRDGATLAAQSRDLCRRSFGPSADQLGRDVVATVRGTVNGLILVGVGEGILLGFAYGILDLPHPALLGALSAMLATIPFGAPLVFGAGALVLLVEGNTVGAVALFAFGSVVTFVADHFVRPALIGGTTRLPFILVLLGILGGIETMGLIGLFLGPAIMAAFVALWRDFAGSGDAPKRLD